MKLPWNKNISETDEITTKQMTAADFERLGRAMAEVYVTGYASKKRLITMSLFRGIGYGLGIFIGGTIIVALLATVIAQFEAVDFLKPIIEPIQKTIQEANGGPVVTPPSN